MRRGFGFVLAWLGATLLAVIVATAAVGSVRSQVTEAPTPLSSPGAQALSSAPITSGSTVPSTSSTTVTTTVPEDATTTAIESPGGTTTTEATTGTSTVPSTTVPPASTTTTASSSYSKTVDTSAGSVRILVDGAAVGFGGAYPKPGWKVELDERGPEVVKVKFERNEGEGEISVVARVHDGELLISVDDHGESHDD